MIPATFEQEQGNQEQDGQSPSPFDQMAPNGQPQQKHAVEALGSGFIINADGIIVTNNHGVKNVKTVSATLSDGTVLPANVIGTDPRTNIAVLKVNPSHPLPFIQLGDCRDVKRGEWVVAMGNPFGLGGTVTAGIVSAVNRDIGAGPYDQFIQVDAPIKKGNSGGPLFTQDGKVIGMNTAIYSPTGGSVRHDPYRFRAALKERPYDAWVYWC
jgi:serine protease Do